MLKSGFNQLELPGAGLLFHPGWLDSKAANSLFEILRKQVAWERHRIKIFGREVESPRLSCWMGDAGANYVYSNTRFEPHAWLPELQSLRERLQAECEAQFNSVLANLYHNGQDSMGWHSDDEPELGTQPVIASISLGETRRFSFKAKTAGAKAVHLELPHGSLLLMRGDTQKNYRHALAKTAKPVGERINLTFRNIS
ncbi:MAG: alpha-ketoglutarate-dependent dioxygenase AlkB family protein [Arenimonas sp.]